MKISKSIALATVLVIAVIGMACNLFGSSSPTATIKAFHEAMQKKDAEGVKKTLSKRAIELLAAFAESQNKTLDEALFDMAGDTSTEKMPETRNEKIDGNKATVEVKNDKTGKWQTIPLVKEDGSWKIIFGA